MATALNSRRSKKLGSVSHSSLRQLPNQEKPPQWLRSLLLAQQASVIATFVLAGSVLAVYGWTVYSQQLWGREYSKLEQLRRSERQITESGEVLKNQIADQSARPGAGLVPSKPENMIFLKTAPMRPDNAVAPSSQASPVAPIGY
ncbi:hypothetical protein NIES2135_15630 [Leptolyngbya boryana NIES-2135]|jgi:hypothetical protein|uniref:Cell division protein FtsL n=1 Tax=Leptolyngbya boryana NIES-2135 TaxID=1973484 RepID=A0A1Z4JD68_LEPBY|nr:hypothetical protein [Leptolyngbya sp. FACHB-402]BAY54745.1 hypothetical protein NIES2135_15630 [Leptolyngbya boryana NIES-2135]